MRQKELWRLAAKHVVLWDKLRRDDYDFQSWTKDARNDENDNLLNAGCCYEYARESHKLRCKLVLEELKRKRELTAPLFLEISEQPARWGMYLIECGWDTWLRTFTDELASNKSFAELLRTSKTKVKDHSMRLTVILSFPKQFSCLAAMSTGLARRLSHSKFSGEITLTTRWQGNGETSGKGKASTGWRARATTQGQRKVEQY